MTNTTKTTKTPTTATADDTILTALKAKFDQTDFKLATFSVDELFQCLNQGDDLSAIRNWAINEKGAKIRAYDSAKHRWDVRNTLGDIPKNAVEFIALYVAREKLTVRYDNIVVHNRAQVNGDKIQRDTRIERDRLALQTLGNRNSSAAFSDRAIGDAYADWVDQSRQLRLSEVLKLVTSDSHIDAESKFDELAQAIADEDDTSIRLTKAVLKTVIWQAKRRLAGLDLYDHVMAILFGPQGGGKSQFWKKFFGMMPDMVTGCNFDDLTSKKDFDLWQFPVLFLDEMEKADRADIEAVKNAITKETHSDRVLFTQNRATVICRHSCVGAMNGRLADKLRDSTGLRRFVGISFRHSPDRSDDPAIKVADWGVINNADYLTLWRSVDHLAEHPLKADKIAYREWLAQQEKERVKDNVELWLDEVKPNSLLPTDATFTTSELRQVYRDWAELNGYKPLVTVVFGRMLSALESQSDFPFTEQKKGGNRTRSWKPEHAKSFLDLLVKDGV